MFTGNVTKPVCGTFGGVQRVPGDLVRGSNEQNYKATKAGVYWRHSHSHFFFVAFQLLAFTRALILQEYEVPIETFVAATVGALVVAKVVVIVDLLPFVNRSPGKPLIYNVIWKSAIYLVAALLVRYSEYLISFVRKYGDIAEANSHLLDEVIWPHFWLVQIWLFVVFLMYCVLKELNRVLGRERLRAIFVGPVKATVA